MIQIKHFSLDKADDANGFIAEHGIKNQGGFHINTEGIFIFYEDGRYSPPLERSMLYEKLMSAKNALAALVPDLSMIEKQIIKIEADIKSMQDEEARCKKDKEVPAMGWGTMTKLKEMAGNQLDNAKIQRIQTVQSMDAKRAEVEAVEEAIANTEK